MANFNLDDYVQVNERIEKFYEKYPDGSIQTEIISNQNGEIIFKAYAFRDREDTRPATGHAMEREGSTYINKTSHIENCETSAVGRALAMLGFEIKKSVASREEVANAKIQQEELSKKITKEQADVLLKVFENLNIAEEDVKKSLANMGVSTVQDLNNEQYAMILRKLKQKQG